jgi:SOS-response transcriptional repressor LexA
VPSPDVRYPLIRIGKDGLEFVCKQGLKQGQRVVLTVNAPKRRGYLKLIGEVLSVKAEGGSHHVDVKFASYSAGMEHRISKLHKGYAGLDEPSEDAIIGASHPKHAAEPVELTAVEEEHEEAADKPDVSPGVAEGELSRQLQSLAVDERLILDVLEACGAGIAVGELRTSESARKHRAHLDPETSIKPIPVYSLKSGASLEFDEHWVAKSPPAGFISVPYADEHCFACELGGDEMLGPDFPSFRPGDIVVFSCTEPVASGDFALVLTESGCVFREVTLAQAQDEDKNGAVVLRPLNDRYEEQRVRRADVRGLWKMIGRCERWR